MHVELHQRFTDTAEGKTARDLTSACVHCGFCLETCPTYLDSRDERDSPRGRIYLIKQLLETGSATEQTRLHLDRCLTCRNCETTCPSGMEYGQLVDIGRGIIERDLPRKRTDAALRRLLRLVFTSPRLLRGAVLLGQVLRPVLPARLRSKIPRRQQTGAAPAGSHPRRMLVLEGCVQQAATPATNAIARKLLDRLGITLLAAEQAGCCGALDYHLAAHEQGLDRMRRNIDAWWPLLEQGCEAIISSASGCGAMLVDYGRLLAADPAYAAKAQRVSALSRDLAEILLAEDLGELAIDTSVGKVAVHTPCSMQHALQKPAMLEDILRRAGFAITARPRPNSCCGSAGSYSILQAAGSERLLDKALDDLQNGEPAVIATANIGCQLHLQSGADIPVVHWIELLDGP